MIIKQPISSDQIPEYHEGQLLVKIRPAMGGAGILAASGDTPGMAALSFFESAGLIKRVTTLATPAEDSPSSAMALSPSSIVTSALSASTHTSNVADPNLGVSIIELQRDNDVADLQVALARDPNIEFVSKVPIRYLHVPRGTHDPKKVIRRGSPKVDGKTAEGGAGVMAIPPPASSMWNLARILWQQARGLPGIKDATDVKVAVLDTGIEPAHPDLVGRISRYLFNYSGIPSASGPLDLIGHGTHVAGTIAAIAGNSFGINGICNCQIHAYKIFDDEPDYNEFNNRFVYYVDPPMYMRALAECVQQRVDVVNLSIGGRGVPSAQELLLFNRLLANGTTVVASMGNERPFGSPTSYPAAIGGVIAVGSTNIDDTVAIHSNRGNHISISAPGVGIWSTLPTYPGQFGFSAVAGPSGQPVIGAPAKRETNYDSWDGTSMASPHVAAAVALLLANKGAMSPGNVRTRLMQSADRVPAMNGLSHHPDFGAGRLNLLRLLQ